MRILLLCVLAVLPVGGAYVWWSWTTFTAATDDEVRRLVAGAGRGRIVITQERLSELPPPVARHLRQAGVVGRSIPSIVRLKQVGRIRSAPDAAWMPLEAEETYSIDPPGFVWRAWLPKHSLPIVFGRDAYLDRRGSITMKLLGTVPVADAHGDELAPAGLMRFLNEMMWFPAAYASPALRWRALDDNAAEVTLADGPLSATATLFCDGDGRLVNFRARRFNTGTGSMETWETPVSGNRTLAGLALPTRGAGIWKLAAGDFSYIELEVTAVAYE
jgi:hypothetical protein